MKKIAFIGLGRMGLPMARNLVAHQYQVTGYDISAERISLLKDSGGHSATSVADAVRSCDYVLSMLQNGQQVLDLYGGSGGVLECSPETALCIDCSTIAPSQARAAHALARQYGRKFIDAPVSGGTSGAENGTLSFLAGGEEAHIELAKPLLSAMGKKTLHAGPAGAGQSAKVCNNMLLAITMIGTAEALALGEKLGLDSRVLTEIISCSSGRNWSLDTYNPVPGIMEQVPASKGYTGGFPTELMIKDLGLAMEASNEVGANTPLGALATALYRLWRQTGGAQLDFSSIYRLVNGVSEQS